MSFFTPEQVVLLDDSVATKIAVVRRRFNAEKNPGIADLLAKDVTKLEELKVAVNNPALLAKVK